MYSVRCFLKILFLISSLGLMFFAKAETVDDSKIIEKITIRGLAKHSPSSVYSYLPVRTGDVFTQAAMQSVVKSLFASNFFRNIKLYQNDNELIIDVVERPWISKVVITGNELIDSEQLESVLESLNIVENRAFNNEKFTQFIAEVESLYYLQGYYGVKILVNNELLDNDRVSLKIAIHEGEITRIARINLIGNHAYKQDDLERLFQIRDDSPDYLFNNLDSYVKASLEGDLQRLYNFYQNRGYARFRLLDKQVSLLPDKSAVLMNIHVEEGAVYEFGDIGVSGYEKVLTTAQVNELLLITKGETFSRDKMLKSVDNLRNAIQNHGYAFVQINPIVRMNDVNKKTFVNFQINIGKRVYVRRVLITGNNITLDDVIRVEMRQFEQALYIPKKVDISRRRLNRLGFFSQVNINVVQVNNQQVDLVVGLNEQRTGSFNMRLGYSPQSGLIYQLSVAEKNWLGRGNQVKIELDLQDKSESIMLGYTDRRFYEDEVSFSWDARYREAKDIDISENSFLLNQRSTNFMIGFPVNEDLRFNYGIGFAKEEIECGSKFLTCHNFVANHDEDQNIASLFVSGTWDLRNRGFLPSQGGLYNFSYRINFPSIGSSYYSYGLTSQFYGALTQSQRSTVRLRLAVDSIQGYNEDEVPFYKRLFVGGAQTVRGYRASSLGPRYSELIDGIDGFKGGTIRGYANLDFYIALSQLDQFSEADDNFRLNVFLDSGYAFEETGNFSVDEFRNSAGLGWIYFSPIGLISIFYAVPINHGSEDQIEQFGFLLGHSL